jgi:mycothiol synthase
LIEQQGFTLDDWTIRHLMQPLDAPVPESNIPTGFQIRPLAGMAETEAYVRLHRAAFKSENMTLDWRQRTLHHPRYRPDLDLVAVNEAGELVAFCIGWLSEAQGARRAQIEPLGVLPEYQRCGLGRALLMENLRRMQQAGAKYAYVDAESYNPASQHLYLTSGFEEEYSVIKYFKQIE